MKITFMGVMGSLPGGLSDLGKNTTSILIEDNDKSIIIDSGTGILNYFETTHNNHHHIIYTHYHLDHVIGLPFVNQLFDNSHSFFLYGPQFSNFNTSNLLPSILNDPLLPFTTKDIKAKITHKEIDENNEYNINGFQISNYIVNHPGKSMVYSIFRNDRKISILTDLPNNYKNDPSLIKLCENSDILYVDSYYLEKEIENSDSNDFGHSSIESAIKIKEKSNSKILVLGHHRYNRLKSELLKYETKSIIIANDNTAIKI